MNNFRTVGSTLEILQLLNQAPKENMGQVWQSLPMIRHIYNLTEVQDDKAAQTIILKTFLDYEFSDDYPIYVRINYRDLIFKMNSKNCVMSGNRLIASYPKFAKAVEERHHTRIPVPLESELSVTLRSMGSSAIDINVQLRDFSKSGLGIYVSELNETYLKKNEFFQLLSVDDYVFSKAPKLHLRYTKRERGGRNKTMAGFKFDEYLQDPVMQSLTTLVLEPFKKV